MKKVDREENKPVTVNISVPGGLHADAKVAAARSKQYLKAFILDAMREKVERTKSKTA